MEVCSSDIIKLSQDLEIIFNEIFNEMNNLVTNGVWSGNAALEFVKKVNLEKINYINFRKNLYNYGVVLKNNAVNFKRCSISE